MIRFELTAPVIKLDKRPGTAAHEMVAASRRMTAAKNEITKALRIVEPVVDTDHGDFSSLIH